MKQKFFVFGFIGIFILSGITYGQSSANNDETLKETLQTLSKDAARSYLSPISSAFGTDLNAGWFHRAPAAKMLGFTFELGFVGMGAYFPDEAKSFTKSGQFRFSTNEAVKLVLNDPNSSLTYDDLNGVQKAVVDEITKEYFDVEMSGPTIIGSDKDNIKIVFPKKEFQNVGGTGADYTVVEQNIELPVKGFKELANASFMPLMTTQFKIGTIAGTNVNFRWLPKVKLQDDLGYFSYFGFGIQHNPEVFLPQPLPLDLALGFFTQRMEIGDIFTTKTTSFGITASKQFGIRIFNVTPYAGFMFENADMEVRYDYMVDLPGGQQEIIPIKFQLEGENKTRLTLGVNFMLLIFNLNADYSIGQYNSFSAGIHFAI
jgi:hypothetical protein